MATKIPSLARLFPKQAFSSLDAELDAERADADAEIAWIIASARQRVPYLSCGVFLPLETIEQHLAQAAAGVERMRAEGRQPDSIEHRVCAGAHRDIMVEYEVAQAIRAARLTVSYADPPDYWARRYKRAMRGCWA